METVMFAIALIVMVGLGVTLGHLLTKKVYKRRIEDLEAHAKYYTGHTDICPTCFGRGRVPKRGYHFTKDPARDAYNVQQIPPAFRKVFDKEDKIEPD